MICGMHLIQPSLRAWHRYAERMRRKLHRDATLMDHARSRRFKRLALGAVDGYWTSRRGRGREELLYALEHVVAQQKVAGVLDHVWEPWDMSLFIDRWHNFAIRTATEELGDNRRFTRVRCVARATLLTRAVGAAAGAWMLVALIFGQLWAQACGGVALVVLGMVLYRSYRNGRALVAGMVDRAAMAAGLDRFQRSSRRRKRRLAIRAGDASSAGSFESDELSAVPACEA
jgi:hypothetical protein